MILITSVTFLLSGALDLRIPRRSLSVKDKSTTGTFDTMYTLTKNAGVGWEKPGLSMGELAEVEDVSEIFLQRRSLREHMFSAQAAPSRCSGGRIQVDDILDAAELFEKSFQAQIQSSVGGLSMQQAA